MLNMVRVAYLPDPIVKVDGKVMENGSTYTVNGSAEVTLTRPEYCPVDAKLVYTKDSAIPSYCVEYAKPITISNQATKLGRVYAGVEQRDKQICRFARRHISFHDQAGYYRVETFL